MKLTKTHSRMLACGLALFALPLVRANDSGKMFSTMDTNGDGQISRAEHAAGAKKMFAEMDADRDGIVTAAEMDAKKEAKAEARLDAKPADTSKVELSVAEKIKAIDKDGDGKLTAAEHAAGSESMFAKMDTNGDGNLSKEEFEAGHKMLKKDKTSS